MRNAESYKPAFNKAWNWVCRQFENGQLKPGMQLPSSQNLAKACGVSRTTMIDVFAILREKEIIEGSKRHRLKIVSIPTSLPPDETAESIPAEIVADTQSQTYNAILKDLLCGRWPPETALPQYKELQNLYKVSYIPLRNSLVRLASEGYLRKEKRRFYSTSTAKTGGNKVYLIVFSYDLSKKGYIRGQHDNELCRHIHIESMRRNLDLIIHKLRIPYPQSGETLDESEITVPPDAFAYIVLLNQPYPARKELLRKIAATGKPMAVIDEFGGAYEEYHARSGPAGFFPFTTGEGGARKIVRTLLRKGHRRFAFISPAGFASWSALRENAIRDELDNTPLDTSFTALSFSRVPQSHGIAQETFNKASKKLRQALKGFPEELGDYFGMSNKLLEQRFRTEVHRSNMEHYLNKKLVELLAQPMPTAWIAVHDQVGIQVLDFLESHKIHVPRQVSVASFDDSMYASDRHMSSYAFNAVAVAHAAINFIISPEMFTKKNEPHIMHIDGEFIERETTGPAPP